MGSTTPTDTYKSLLRQIEPFSFWSYTGTCDVTLENGARCCQPAVGFFTANAGLRNIEMCQLHTLLTLKEMLLKLSEADLKHLLQKQNVLHLLLSELTNDDTPLLGTADPP
jgi:hypothetical protein